MNQIFLYRKLRDGRTIKKIMEEVAENKNLSDDFVYETYDFGG